MYQSGFVALIGRPNVGKSTLMNALVGEKAAIISDKPQTTRNRIRGILTEEKAQVVFIDTPGIHRPKHKLSTRMVESALRTLNEVDLVLFLVDAGDKPGKGDKYIVDLLKKVDRPVFLVLNKIDMLDSAAVEDRLQGYNNLLPFEDRFAVSALEGRNLDELRQKIVSFLPEGPQYYPADMITDQPEWFVAAELIREKTLQLLQEEVPFSIAVDVEEIKERQKKDLIDVRAVIYVERDSQKGIIIGRDGQMLKQIGKMARVDLERLLGSRVFLDLWVKVKKDWRNKEKALQEFGYWS